MDAVEMKDALQKFVNWIKAKNKKVDLFAHNANAFDSKWIIYTLMRCNLLNPFTECVLIPCPCLKMFFQKGKHIPRKAWSQICWAFLMGPMTPSKM